MNSNLVRIVKQITAQYGEGILGDPARLKPLFSDLAKDEPKPLRIAFGRCVENGAYMVVEVLIEVAGDVDIYGSVLDAVLIVLTYGILRLRGSNGKSAWEQLG